MRRIEPIRRLRRAERQSNELKRKRNEPIRRLRRAKRQSNERRRRLLTGEPQSSELKRKRNGPIRRHSEPMRKPQRAKRRNNSLRRHSDDWKRKQPLAEKPMSGYGRWLTSWTACAGDPPEYAEQNTLLWHNRFAGDRILETPGRGAYCPDIASQHYCSEDSRLPSQHSQGLTI